MIIDGKRWSISAPAYAKDERPVDLNLAVHINDDFTPEQVMELAERLTSFANQYAKPIAAKEPK